jgi:cysteine-rich repeat protein
LLGGGVCEDSELDLARLLGPLASDAAGAQLLPALESGEDSCSSDAQCAVDETCVSPPLGICQPDAPALVTAGAPDNDADGVDDVHDNCPRRANADQADLDGDSAGDACDLETCGDGVQAYTEQCDGGNALAGDGCDDACQLEVGAVAACQNGIDDDGDGRTDLADQGCLSASDTSERHPTRRCDNGRDDDGDGKLDFALAPLAAFDGDLGCASEGGTTEEPACQNGRDDDGDGLVDFDGGASLGLASPPDPYCTSLTAAQEAPPQPPPGCGLGPELLALLPLLEGLRRRRATPRARAR